VLRPNEPAGSGVCSLPELDVLPPRSRIGQAIIARAHVGFYDGIEVR
jgi:hypothetical protein